MKSDFEKRGSPSEIKTNAMIQCIMQACTAEHETRIDEDRGLIDRRVSVPKSSITARRGDDGFEGAETCVPCGLGESGSRQGGEG